MLPRVLRFFVLYALLEVGISYGQATPSDLTGTPPGVNSLPIRLGQVTLDSGNLYLDLPIYSRPGRGVPSQGLHFYYNSQFWLPSTGCCGSFPLNPQTSGWAAGFGGLPQSGAAPVTYDTPDCPGNYPDGTVRVFQQWEATDPNGTTHYLTTDSPTYDFECYNDHTGERYTPPSGFPANSQAITDGYTLLVTDGGVAQLYTPDGSTAASFNNIETPNGNLSPWYTSQQIDPTDNTYIPLDNFGTPLLKAASTCPSLLPSGSAYRPSIPFAAQADVICKASVPSWDGSNQGVVDYSWTYSHIPVCTAYFPQDSADDFCGGIWVISNISLPDGTAYSFSYDQGSAPGHYGFLTGLTLPTGGTLTFSYKPKNAPFVPAIVAPLSLIHTVTDNNGTTTIDYTVPGTSGPMGTTLYPITITYPAHATGALSGNVTDTSTFTYTSTNVNTFYTIALTRQDTLNGTLVRTFTQDYTNPANPLYQQTTWNETGDILRTDYTYTNALVSDRKQSINGSLYRTLHTDYLADTSTVAYNSVYHMYSYPISKKLLNSSNQIISEVDYTYDEYAASYCNASPVGLGALPMLSLVPGASGHDDSKDASWVARGNPTTVTYIASPTQSVTTHNCYDTLGNVTETVDGRGNATRFQYTDNFADSNCLSTNLPTYALPTTVIDPLGHATISTYNSCLRAATRVAGPNDVSAGRQGTSFHFDSTGRPLCTNYPDGGVECLNYTSPPGASIQHTQLLSSVTGTHSQTTTLDPYGNVAHVRDDQAGSTVDYTYDTAGRVQTISVPYFVASTIVPSSQIFYDGLGRTTAVIAPDSSSSTTIYTGLNEDVYDQRSSHRKLQFNPLGQLGSITELGTPNSSFNLTTSYAYDLLGNVQSVIQTGNSQVARDREFRYDALSRLLTAYNPEIGWTCYGTLTTGTVPTQTNCMSGYDPNGNLQWKTSSRGITTHFVFDALNRVTSQSYSNGAPSSCYQYDSSSLVSTGGNLIGNLVDAWKQSGSCPNAQPAASATSLLARRSWLSFDEMGRPLAEQQCTLSNCGRSIYSPVYSYDKAGNVVTHSDGVGQFTFTNGYDSASRLLSMTSNNQSYATSIFSSPVYSPAGKVTQATLGVGLFVTKTYDVLNRIAGEIDAGSGPQGGTPGSATIPITP